MLPENFIVLAPIQADHARAPASFPKPAGAGGQDASEACGRDVAHRDLTLLALLDQAYRQIGQSPHAAMNSARLAYAAYLGFMQMNLVFGRERISHEDYDEYVGHLIATLVP